MLELDRKDICKAKFNMLFSFDIKYRFFSFLVQFIESVVTVFRNDPLLSEIFDVIRNSNIFVLE